jgi:hypothetical protein
MTTFINIKNFYLIYLYVIKNILSLCSQIKYMKDANKIVSEVTNYVNTFGDVHTEFIKSMESEHRTLQQSFTRLCLKWIEHVGSEEYRYDLRNEQSHKTCRLIMELFRDYQGLTYDGVTLEIMSKPSGLLVTI